MLRKLKRRFKTGQFTLLIAWLTIFTFITGKKTMDIFFVNNQHLKFARGDSIFH